MIQRCLKMIYLSRGTETTNRNGLLFSYFKRKLPEPTAIPLGKNTKGQYYCEPDLEIEVYL